MSTASPVVRSRSPATSRVPMTTATSATEIEARNSSTAPERNATRRVRHGGGGVGPAELAHAPARTALAAQRLEGAQPGEQVEQLGAEALHDVELLGGVPLREQPDEPHEHRDERERGGDDQRGDEVEAEHDEQRRGRDRRGEQQLGQVAHEVRLEVVQAAGGQGDHLLAVAGGQPARALRDGGGEHLRAQVGDDVPGRPVGEGLLDHQHHEPARDHRGEGAHQAPPRPPSRPGPRRPGRRRGRRAAPGRPRAPPS